MSDCVFWGFEDHMRHLGLPVEPFAHELFRAMRKPTLPEKKEVWAYGWEDDRGYVHKAETELSPYSGRPVFGNRSLRSYDFSWTHGSVAPLILHTLATYHGLRIRGQYDAFYSPEFLEKTATTDIQQNIATQNIAVFGREVEVITLEPAIYLMIDGPVTRHAMFSTTVPHNSGMIAGAYQIYVP